MNRRSFLKAVGALTALSQMHCSQPKEQEPQPPLFLLNHHYQELIAGEELLEQALQNPRLLEYYASEQLREQHPASQGLFATVLQAEIPVISIRDTEENIYRLAIAAKETDQTQDAGMIRLSLTYGIRDITAGMARATTTMQIEHFDPPAYALDPVAAHMQILRAPFRNKGEYIRWGAVVEHTTSRDSIFNQYTPSVLTKEDLLAVEINEQVRLEDGDLGFWMSNAVFLDSTSSHQGLYQRLESVRTPIVESQKIPFGGENILSDAYNLGKRLGSVVHLYESSHTKTLIVCNREPFSSPAASLENVQRVNCTAATR